MTFLDTLSQVPGLTHYYPLATDAKDVVGSAHGANHGAVFKNGAATFNGSSYIELPDHDDFSVATKGGLTILASVAIADWRGAGASEYVHWAGKGGAGAHEWTFRHYVKGGTGEAPTRQGRTSFYHFNPAGGLGAGSYFQDPSFPTGERMFAAFCGLKTIGLAVNGVIRDTDQLSGYSIKPQNAGAPVRLGTRGDKTGFLIGSIRRVAFFNRVLSPAEITKIHDARGQDEGTAPAPTPAPTPPAEDYQANLTNLLSKHNALAKVLRDKGIV